MTALGRHLLIDFHDCDPSLISDCATVRSAMLAAAERSGASIVTDVFHQFNPFGVSGVVVISESHFAIHTWPEHRTAAVDIFTCSHKINFEFAISFLNSAFGVTSYSVSDISRGNIYKTTERLADNFV